MPRVLYDLSPFGQDHFGTAALGDCRRTFSLVDLANRLRQQPQGALPLKFRDPKALRRCYDLMKVPAVTHKAVLEPHVRRTLRLIRQQQGVVLLLHDGSELDYSGLPSLHPQLGQIGAGQGKGYECRNSLSRLHYCPSG